MKTQLGILFLLCTLCMTACGSRFNNTRDMPDLDSLLVVLDQTIEHKERYVQHRQHRIDSLQQLALATERLGRKFDLYHEIFQNYFDFQNDYAAEYVKRMLELGEQMRSRNPEYLLSAKIDQASLLRYTGQLKEAFEILDEVSRHELSPRLYRKYISERIVNYIFLRDNALSDEHREHYEAMAEVCRDTLFLYLAPDDGLLFRLSHLKNSKTPEQALALLHKAYSAVDPLSKRAGMLAYNIALYYEKIGDGDNFKRYLVRSAIADLQNGVRGYKSMQRLATAMYEDGDIDRAYTYIKCSIEDAIVSDARIRTQEATNMFVVITHLYQQQTEEQRKAVVGYLGIICIVGVLLFISLVVMLFQYYQLWCVKRNLVEANKIKENYLGFFIEEYLNHLSRMNGFQMKSIKLIKNQDDWTNVELFFDEVFHDTADLKELYRKFDAAILHIFPGFVEEFNQLMIDSEHETPQKAGTQKLTTEQRIAAFIRLGISDSEKIALLLRYSIRTVYNNRSQMNLKAKSPQTLEEDIMRIGIPKRFSSKVKSLFWKH